jgi:hypothetical protein
MAQVLTGEVAALLTPPQEAWQHGVLPRGVASAAVSFGAVIDVASLEAVYGEMAAPTGLQRRTMERFTEANMDAPFAMPTHLVWLAGAMGASVVVRLGEEPVLPNLPTDSLWSSADPNTGKMLEGAGLYGITANPVPEAIPEHLRADLPAQDRLRPVTFFPHAAGELSVGQQVRVLPLFVPAVR